MRSERNGSTYDPLEQPVGEHLDGMSPGVRENVPASRNLSQTRGGRREHEELLLAVLEEVARVLQEVGNGRELYGGWSCKLPVHRVQEKRQDLRVETRVPSSTSIPTSKHFSRHALRHRRSGSERTSHLDLLRVELGDV